MSLKTQFCPRTSSREYIDVEARGRDFDFYYSFKKRSFHIQGMTTTFGLIDLATRDSWKSLVSRGTSTRSVINGYPGEFSKSHKGRKALPKLYDTGKAACFPKWREDPALVQKYESMQLSISTSADQQYFLIWK